MNNAELAEQIAAANDLTKAAARKIVDEVFAAVGDAVAGGKEVSINGFGKFKAKSMPARKGRNPATGAAIEIAATKKLSFAAAKAIKDRLNG